MSAGSRGGKDFYKVLNVSKTATTHEIKQAYRKLAMALHPDRNQGDPQKAAVFKQASEAYNVLSDHSQRTQYDNITGNNQKRRRAPPRDYRKVYSPKAPPGFGKTFDSKRHWEYHYGDGMMRDEVERARRRAEAASSRNSGFHYQSPLGKGFSFTSEQDHNPYSKRSKQGPRANRGGEDLEYEEAHYYDLGSTDMNNARRVVSRQEYIRQRMHERRKNRPPRPQKPHEEEATGCHIM
jgi:DnaJ-class molecular chaperone